MMQGNSRNSFREAMLFPVSTGIKNSWASFHWIEWPRKPSNGKNHMTTIINLSEFFHAGTEFMKGRLRKGTASGFGRHVQGMQE
jgi:hypothetical protein